MERSQILFILLTIIIICLFIYIYYKFRVIEKYDNIVSQLHDNVGFYSQFFFVMNHYLYCKENRRNFTIDSQKWLFNSKEGWNDYFETIDLKFNNNDTTKTVGHQETLSDYKTIEYKNIISEVYKYNKKTIDKIDSYKTTNNLLCKEYDSIRIRRGDKLAAESMYIDEKKYIEHLLQKNPLCKKIFVSTDDYNAFIGIQDYITNNNLNIEITTSCDKNNFGFSTNNTYKNGLKDSINREYVDKVIDKINESKSVVEMNSDEKYNHTIDLLIDVDILINSNICVLDYQSNISRFVKLAHNNSENVYDILNPNSDIDYEKKVCPAYSF